jgi:S1-C subfamily serine protease
MPKSLPFKSLFLICSLIATCSTSFAQSNLSIAKFINRVISVNMDGATSNAETFDSLAPIVGKSGQVESVSPKGDLVGWMSACLNISGEPCTQSIRYDQRLRKILARTTGKAVLDPSMEQQIRMPEMVIETTSKVVSVSEDGFDVEVAEKFQMNPIPVKNTYRVKLVPSMRSRTVRVGLLEKDISDRRPISEVTEAQKTLSQSVFQIVSPKDPEAQLGGESSGTGFFISANGYALTNHHVISGSRECMEKFKCELILRQTKPDGQSQEIKVIAHLLAANSGYDFALLRIEAPAEFKIQPLEFEKNVIGPGLMTLGYPGDFHQDDKSWTRLTYSFGKLVGFDNRLYATSVYIYGGASGSALLNMDGKIVALLSNGTGNPGANHEGMPGLARPIEIIDQVFGLTDYLSGQKQARIKAIIQGLSTSQKISEAHALMEKYRGERTYLGAVALKQLMIAHANLDIRKEILSGLENAGIIRGDVLLPLQLP